MTVTATKSLPDSLGIVPFTSRLLLKRCECFPNMVSAIYRIGLDKAKTKTFELRCISSAYFEDLIFHDTFGVRFKGDVPSCALVSINSLAALSATSQSWVKLRKPEDNPHAEEVDEKIEGCCERVEDVPVARDAAESSTGNENCYLIQCCGASSVPTDFALYVTAEKYFNILKRFGVNVIENLTLQVGVEKSVAGVQPQKATHVVLGCIVWQGDMDVNNLERLMKKYFETPKYLKNEEVFEINVQKMGPTFVPSSENFGLENIYFKVLSLSRELAPFRNQKEDFDGYYVVDGSSELIISSKVQSFIHPLCKKYVSDDKEIGYEIPICPGGLEKYYSRLRKLFKLFISNDKLHLKPLILLTGPKGSGKKAILKCAALSFGMKVFTLNCFDFIGVEGSALDFKYQDLASKIRQMAPCAVLLENIELVGRNNQCQTDVASVDQFQKFVERMFKKKLEFPLVVVASTSSKDSGLVPSIERMFVETVAFEALKSEEVFDLLSWSVKDLGLKCSPEILSRVSKKLNGCLFADVAKLMRLALKYQREDAFEPGKRPLLLTDEHFGDAIRVMYSLYSDSIGSAKIPSVHWEDVGGLANVKEEIMTALNMYLKHPELASSGLKCSGFLFYGPPGTGKTLMAKAVATECACNFLSVKGPELINMYVGQSEKNVREVFQRARNAAPCIIFFDELDSLAPNRGRDSVSATDRVVSQLLTEMDGLESNRGVFIIGATNRPDLVDPALIRPGRFDKKFHVGVCRDKTSKLNVIKALTKRFSLSDDVDLQEIVERLPEEVTGADIYSVCSDAWLETARRSIRSVEKGEEISLPLRVTREDFRRALDGFAPSLTPEVIEYYERFKSSDQ